MSKYRALRERVSAELPELRLAEAPAASPGELALAHDPDYIDRVFEGRLDAREQRVIGFPWSNLMVERSRRSAGATIAACRRAFAEGVAVNLAGGTHHAHRDRGQGYCVFNDAAVAARLMQAERGRQRRALLDVAIVDLDVHQGNGTATILAHDPSVFTLSIHGATNFPFRKEAGDLDVGLPEGTGDDAYLEALDRTLIQMVSRFSPGLVIYVSGADAHEGDRLGKLRLTCAGMRERDRRVFALAERLGVPIAVTMAGGYGHDISVTVDVHVNTVREALALWRRTGARVSS